MGAKQSKRSVDISGKEAEGASEVAAAGAGGEGRVEPLADADALKPQLNGDAHVHESTEKEKQLDSGTPENEKDATTEKEAKVEENIDNEKDSTQIANGENTEVKENGETTPTAEETKKPKKEKVKKKWSLRSISFSRKDKPKQEKKQKDEEAKTNGEPEKVPEEAAEVISESAANGTVEDKTENKDEKTPETPVTEPITNGSNTPESPKVEISPAEEIAVELATEIEKPKTNVEPEPEKLPINGLSLEEPINEAAEIAQTEESKPEDTPAVTTEPVPVIEIPVQKEVCVDQMPLIESTPPPLPANPPPSSVASFAATTMAPELTDASLPNTTETAISTPPLIDAKAILPKESSETPSAAIATNNELDLSVYKEQPPETEDKPTEMSTDVESKQITESPIATEKTFETLITDEVTVMPEETETEVKAPVADEIEKPVSTESPELSETAKSETSTSQSADDFPPPPPPLEDDMAMEERETEAPVTQEQIHRPDVNVINSNYPNGQSEVVANGDIEDATHNGNKGTEHENLKNKSMDELGNAVEIECNGNAEEVVAANGKMEPTENGKELAEASDAASPQEPIVVSDKIADLIPEIPVVPEIKTDTLQETSDAVAAN